MRSVALGYASLGLAPIPLPRGQKRPARRFRWRQWQDEPPTEAEIHAMFATSGQWNIAAICGRASQNLLVLDCDDPQTYAQSQTRLGAAGIQTWAIERPPNGSLHDGGGSLVLRTPVPVKSTKLNGMDILGQGRYVLLPPSEHPGGGFYTFASVTGYPFTLPTLDALPWLRLEPAPPPLTQKLPRLAWKLLQGDQKVSQKYLTRSETEAAICASLVNAGFSFDDCLRLFQRFPAAGKFAEMHQADPKHAKRWLALTWHNAERFVQDNPGAATKLAEELRTWALSRPWPGRTGATDRAVYRAHLAIVEKCAKDTYAASCRELAELAGVHWDTASKATHRLRDAGLLELVQEATATLSARYRLVPDAVDADSCASSDTPSQEGVRECRRMHATHDAFRRSGLNKSGAEIWAVLAERGTVTEKELEVATGRHRTTIRRKLRQMFKYAMCEPLGEGIWRMLDQVNLDGVAAELGTAGMGERQREKHRQDRALHRMVLERERAEVSGSKLAEVRLERKQSPSVLGSGDRVRLLDGSGVVQADDVEVIGFSDCGGFVFTVGTSTGWPIHQVEKLEPSPSGPAEPGAEDMWLLDGYRDAVSELRKVVPPSL